MHYFVTGGTGFIGAQLIHRLLKEGHTVTALVRPKSVDKIPLQHENLHWVKGNLEHPTSFSRSLNGCDGVFHMAAIASVWAPQEKDFWDINVQGTENVLKSAEEQGVNRLIFTSTAATLPPADTDNPSDEKSTKNEFLTPYDHTKLIAEERVRSFGKHNNLQTIIVNPSRVYGPGTLTESNAVTRIIKYYIDGKWRFLPGNGYAVGNYVYIDDVVEGHLLAMKRGLSGEQYILGGENLSFQQFFDHLAEVTGRRRLLIPLPQSLIRLFGHVEKTRARIFKSPPIITPAWVDKYLDNWAINSQKAINELGYSITSTREAMQKTVQWLQTAHTE